MVSVEVFTLSGTPLKNLWAQSHVFEEKNGPPFAQGYGGAREKLFACISIEGPEDFDGRLVGRKILSSFEEGYYSAGENPYKSLLKSLSGISNIIPTLTNEADKLFFDFTAAVFYRGVLYVGIIGSGGAKIYRDGKLLDLFKKPRSNKETTVASGFVKINDLFLLYTSAFLIDITNEEMEENLKNNNAAEVSDRMAPYLMKGEKSSVKAAMIMGVVEREPSFASEEASADAEALADKSAGKEVVEQPVTQTTDKREIKFFSGVREGFSNFKNKAKPRIFLRKEGGGENTKRTAFTIGIVLIVMLVASVSLGMKKREEGAFKKSFVPLYKEATDKYDEGASLLELNPPLSKTPLSEAKQKTEELLKLVGERKTEKAMVLELSNKIDDAIAGSSKTYKISEPNVFYDLTILGDKAEGTGWSLYDKNALIFDMKNSTAYNVGLSGKSGGVVAGESDLNGVSIFSMGDGKVEFFSSSKGVLEATIGKSGLDIVIKKDDEWGEIAGMAAFGKNVYLLDKNKSSIWKYAGGESGYLSKSNYFAIDIKPDLSKAVKIIIDGSVWINTTDGELFRYTTGRLDPINLSGLSENLGELTDFYTDDTSKFVYVLDQIKKRVVLFDKKSGVYQAQYVWENMKNITGIAADEENKKIFLLGGSKIYAIELK